jgi:hypothetical protein
MSGIMQAMMGSTAYVELLPDYTLQDTGATPNPQTVRIQLTNTGILNQDQNGSGWVNVGNWLVVGSVADYEVYLGYTGDAPSGSSTGTWLNLGTTRDWTWTTTLGILSANVLLSIGPAGSSGANNYLTDILYTVYVEST